MGDESWEERCNRYFSSISDTDKDRDQEKHKPTRHRPYNNNNNSYLERVDPNLTPDTDKDNVKLTACGSPRERANPGVGGVDGTAKASGVDTPWKSLSQVKDRTSEHFIVRHIRKACSVLDAHGSQVVYRSRATLELCLWLVVIVLAIAFTVVCGYLLTQAFHDDTSRTSYHIATNHAASVSSPTVPSLAITICNLNVVKKSLVPTNGNMNLKQLLQETQTNNGNSVYNTPPSSVYSIINRLPKLNSLLKKHFSMTGKDTFQNVIRDLQKQAVIAEMVKESNISLLHRLKELGRPELLGEVIGISKSNIERMGHVVKDMVLECWTDGYNCAEAAFEEFIHPNLGRCVTIAPPRWASNLQLILDAQSDEYIPELSPVVGFTVLVHDAKLNGDPSSGQSHRIAVAKDTSLAFEQMTMIKRKQPCCSHTDVQSCMSSCLHKHVSQVCECTAHDVTQCPMLDPEFYVCYKAVERLLKMKPDLCGCKDPCTELVLEVDADVVDWPSEASVGNVVAALTKKRSTPVMNSTHIRSNVAKVTIQLIPGRIIVMEETDKKSLLHLLASIGGVAALISGVSIVSLVELVYILVKLLISAVKKCCSRNEQDTTPQRLTDSEITSITWAMYRQKRLLEENRTPTNQPATISQPSTNIPQNSQTTVGGNAFSRISKRNVYLINANDMQVKKDSYNENHQSHVAPDYDHSLADGPTYHRRYDSRADWNLSRSSNNNGLENQTAGYQQTGSNSALPMQQQYQDNNVSHNGTVYPVRRNSYTSTDNRLETVMESQPNTIRTGTEQRKDVPNEGIQFYNGTSAYFTSNTVSEPVYL